MVKLSRPLSFDEYALIIEHVNANWELRPALKALCLAQRILVPLCQKHIFSSITCSSQKVDTFPDIASASPHLFDYIRSFDYEVDDSPQLDSVKTRRNTSTVQLFEKLHALRLLSVSTAESYAVRWEVIDPQVRNALLRLILSPTLRSISLSKIRKFPPTGILGLRNSRHLETISLSNITLNLAGVENFAQSMNVNTSASDSAVIPHPSKINAYVGSEGAILALVGGPNDGSPFNHPPVFDFTGLRNIYAEICDNEANANYLLIRSASQLEDLFLVLAKKSTETFAGLAASLLLGPFQTLRSLRLHTMEPHEDDEDPFLASVPELKKLAGGKMKSLENIDMFFNLFTSDAMGGPRSLCRVINAECKALDSIFADRDAFPGLRSISIYFIISIFNDAEFGDFVLERQFNAVSRKIRQQSFKNLDAIPTINNSFRLEMEWTDE